MNDTVDNCSSRNPKVPVNDAKIKPDLKHIKSKGTEAKAYAKFSEDMKRKAQFVYETTKPGDCYFPIGLTNEMSANANNTLHAHIEVSSYVNYLKQQALVEFTESLFY